jgi:hypothetical protein
LEKDQKLVILMLDRFIYKFFEALDNLFSKIETVAIDITTWLWQQRVKLLRKKRGRKK